MSDITQGLEVRSGFLTRLTRLAYSILVCVAFYLVARLLSYILVSIFF